MPRITKTVSINAAPEKIIDYIANVKNHPAFISSLKSVDNMNGESHQVGSNWDWVFTMVGVELHGKAETKDYTPGKHYSFMTTGGVSSTFSYGVEPEGQGSRLTVDVSYEVPDNVIAKMVDKSVVERLNAQEADRTTENLKAILEV